MSLKSDDPCIYFHFDTTVLLSGSIDPVKVKYIIDQMETGRSTKDIAFEMNISRRWAQKLYARYCNAKKIPVLGKPGRPKKIVHDHVKQIVMDYYREYKCGAAELEIIIKL